MDIVLIGAGRLATQLGLTLRGAGHRITAVFSRTLASATMLTERVGGKPTDSLAELPMVADVFIVAVKDSVVAQLLPQLAKGREDCPVFHTAGSLPLSVFCGTGFTHYGVLYPMQTFSKERKVDFARVPFFIEGNDELSHSLARTLATSVSGDVRELSSEARRHLHLAAVFACNFVNHCYELSADVLQECHLPFDVMLPLIEETAEKVRTMHPHDAQTGPAVRYDEQVIQAQSMLLADRPQLRAVYDLLSKSIHQSHQPQK